MLEMLILPSTINHLEASDHKAWRTKAQAVNWQLDLSDVNAFDSSLVALLLDLQRTAQQTGERLHIMGAPHRLTQLATLYGVEALIA